MNSSSKETIFASLYDLFSPSDSLISAGALEEAAMTVKSDRSRYSVTEPCIGKSGLIVALIS